MDGRRWGFEEGDDPDLDDAPSAPTPATARTVPGQDAEGMVTVDVTLSAEVVSVTLTPGWRDTVDPRRLHVHVLAAANDATMRALLAHVEQQPPTGPADDAAPPPPAAPDDTPLTRQDVLRLVDAVSADLARFSQRLSDVVDHPVSAESAGRHVRGSARRGQVVELTTDARWAGSARDTEIESELVDVLRTLQRSGSPGELGKGPQSPAITELMRLASDPHTFLRRLGLLG